MALVSAGSAAAQTISDIQSTAGSSYAIFGVECPGGGTNCYSAPVPLVGGKGSFADSAGTGGAIYNSYVNVGSVIEFESANAVSQADLPPLSSFTSSSTVSFLFNNDTGKKVNFHSEIIPQGLGMYLADTSDGCLFTSNCKQVSGADHQFSDLSPLGDFPIGILGQVGFSFEIFDNGERIYELSGSLGLARVNFGEGPVTFFAEDFGNADAGPMAVLKNFQQDTSDEDLSARTFSWDATGVNRKLSPGEHLIEYRTSVTSYTSASCIDGGAICLLGFAGFGDPVGRGGGISASFARSFSALSEETDPSLITHLNFQPQTFQAPVFDGQHLVFNRSGVVPEPGTWALMITGFGFAGAALRRRRVPAHI